MAILAAKIGNLDHPAHEYIAAKPIPGGGGGALMKRCLLAIGRDQIYESGLVSAINHPASKPQKSLSCKDKRKSRCVAAGPANS